MVSSTLLGLEVDDENDDTGDDEEEDNDEDDDDDNTDDGHLVSDCRHYHVKNKTKRRSESTCSSGSSTCTSSSSPLAVSPVVLMKQKQLVARKEKSFKNKKPDLKRRNTCGTLYVGSPTSAPDKDATIKVSNSSDCLFVFVELPLIITICI